MPGPTINAGQWVADLIPLHSELRSVEDFDSLLRSFVDSLPGKIAAIRDALQSTPEAAGVLLHKLQGSAGGYGYPMISRVVSELEKKVKEGKSATELQNDLSTLDELVRRAQLGLGPELNA